MKLKLKPMKAFRFIVSAVSSPVKRETTPKLQNNNPSDIPPSQLSTGPFCIRANCKLVDKYSHETLADFIGYDTDYAIIKKTQNACNRVRKNASHCDDPNITIIPTHKIQSCDGHIIYKNHVEKSTSIMFPK